MPRQKLVAPSPEELARLPDDAYIRAGFSCVVLNISRTAEFALRSDPTYRQMCPVVTVAGTRQRRLGDLRDFQRHCRRLALPVQKEPRRQRRISLPTAA